MTMSPDASLVREGIYFIPESVTNPEMPYDCNTYIIGKPASRDLTVVDPGFMGTGKYKMGHIERYLQSLGLGPECVKRFLFTHSHLDHLGCYRELRESFPEAELWMHTAEAEPLEAGNERFAYALDDVRDQIQLLFGLRPGDFAYKFGRKLHDGEILNIGDMTWEVLHIPGHSPGCVAFYNRDDKILLPGDVVYAGHQVGNIIFNGADPPELLRSVERLAELDVDILLPAHMGIIDGLPSGYLSKTAEDKQYLNRFPKLP